MTEQEFQKQLKEYRNTQKMPVSLALKLLSEVDLNCMYEEETYVARDMAIKALDQISTIEQIINSPVYIQEDVIRYKMICEVMAGKRDDKGRAYRNS